MADVIEIIRPGMWSLDPACGPVLNLTLGQKLVVGIGEDIDEDQALDMVGAKWAKFVDDVPAP